VRVRRAVLRDAGMAIGFSTVGYAKGREPTADERKLYGIPEDDEAATILEFYRLKKIDAVDDPSVIDAWTKEANQLAVTTEESLGGAVKQEEQVMKTLADLKEKAPELFALHEQAIQIAVAANAADLNKQIETLKSEGEALKKNLGESQAKVEASDKALGAIRGYLAEITAKLGKEHAVEVPYREVSEKDAAEKIEALTKAGEAKDAEIASLKAAAEKAVKEAAEREAAAAEAKRVAEEAAAEAKRVADVKAKVESLLKSNRFAEQIRKAVEKATPDKAFDTKAAEALIAEKTAEYEAVAAVRVDPDLGITGITTLNEEQTSTGSDAEALPIAAEMAKAL
jgi:chromosome segregation ATPase